MIISGGYSNSELLIPPSFPSPKIQLGSLGSAVTASELRK